MPSERIVHVKAGDEEAVEQLGPYQLETLIDESDELSMTAYRVRIEPGSRTAISYHTIAEELYFVVAGAGVAVLDGVDYPLAAGDFLRLPPGTRHGFITTDRPLVLLDVHSPGSRPDRDVYFEGKPPPGFADNQPPT